MFVQTQFFSWWELKLQILVRIFSFQVWLVVFGAIVWFQILNKYWMSSNYKKYIYLYFLLKNCIFYQEFVPTIKLPKQRLNIWEKNWLQYSMHKWTHQDYVPWLGQKKKKKKTYVNIKNLNIFATDDQHAFHRSSEIKISYTFNLFTFKNTLFHNNIFCYLCPVVI